MSTSRGFRMLLVEDNPDDVVIIEEALTEDASLTSEIAVAPSLAAARGRLAQATFDVIVTDLNLPDSLGLDTVDALRELAEATPLIVLTGLTDLATGVGALQRGAHDYLPKNGVTATSLAGSIRYATDRSRTELALREAHERFRFAFDSSPIGMIIVSLHPAELGSLLQVNGALERLTGYSKADLTARKLTDLVHPDNRGEQQAALNDLAAARREVHHHEPLYIRADGQAIWVNAHLSAVRATRGAEYAIGMVEAFTERLGVIIDNSIAGISVRDRDARFVLTNQAFRQFAGRSPDAQMAGLTDAEVLGAEAAASLLVGHHRVLAGERVTQEQAVWVDGQERTLLSQRFPLCDGAGQVYAIGEVATDITERKRAEDELCERISWEQHISRAVGEGRLLVYAQPIIDLATGALWGEELLVRMFGGPGAEVVEPADFLPHAERFGLMPIIDQFMVTQAVKLAAAGRRISVNVSASSIQTSALSDQITLALAAAPHAAPNLTFEITETAALAAPDIAWAFSEHLAELGAGLALDDFGTGYGGLTELRTLRLHSLKIDLSFVRNLADSTDDQRVVKLIIHAAREFGLTTTAEGVEDAQALQLLREYGADRAQGYFIGKPAPVRP